MTDTGFSSLDTVLNATLQGGIDTFVIPPGWGQGKATFGGLGLGGLVRAMAKLVRVEGATLRSVQAALVGPTLEGTCQLSCRSLRQGSQVEAIYGELTSSGQVATQATAVFCKPRAYDGALQRRTAPTAPAWQEVAVAEMPQGLAPEFTQHFEFRPVVGFPFSGGDPLTVGYIRTRVLCSTIDVGWLMAMADAWWLAIFVHLAPPRPSATLTFTLDLHQDLSSIAPDVPMLHRGEVISLQHGYATETRELWQGGKLIASTRQLVAVIK
jgi:Thioesterase-like superfamily